MKVNLPINMANSGATVLVRQPETPDHETISPFSVQMSQILHRHDEDDGISGGYARPDHDETGDDAKGSLSSGKGRENEPQISGRDPRMNFDSGKDAGQRQDRSGTRLKEGYSRVSDGTDSAKADNASGQFRESVRDDAGGNGKAASEISAAQEADSQVPPGPEKNTAGLQQNVEGAGAESGRSGIRITDDSRLQSGRLADVISEGIAKGQETAESVQGGKTAEDISASGGSQSPRNNFTKPDAPLSPVVREMPFAASSQSLDNAGKGAGISDDAGTNSRLFGIREGLSASAGESGLNREIQSLNAEQGHAVKEPLESGKIFRTESGSSGDKAMPVQDPPNRQDAFESSGFSRAPDFIEDEKSAKTSEGGAPSNGDNEESGDHSRPTSTSKTHPLDAIASRVVPGREADPAKSFQTEMSSHLSSGPSHASGSSIAAGINAEKPVMPPSNEFLSRVAERIHFLIRNGGDAVRIRLQPDEFGNLEIRAESTARGMAVRISAEIGSVKSILENNLHILQQNLQELGLKVDRIQVMLQDFFDAQSNTGNSSRSGHFNPGQNEKDSHRNFNQNENSPEEAIPDNADAAVFSRDGRFHTVA